MIYLPLYLYLWTRTAARSARCFCEYTSNLIYFEERFEHKTLFWFHFNITNNCFLFIYITKLLVETDKNGWELKGWELRFEKSADFWKRIYKLIKDCIHKGLHINDPLWPHTLPKTHTNDPIWPPKVPINFSKLI